MSLVVPIVSDGSGGFYGSGCTYCIRCKMSMVVSVVAVVRIVSDVHGWRNGFLRQHFLTASLEQMVD